MEYSGDHRTCDNADCFASSGNMSQDISWQPNCVCCKKDLSNAPKASIFDTPEDEDA